jgi:hypothetical protein
MKEASSNASQAASRLIDRRIAELGDWRGETLGTMRKLIHEASAHPAEASATPASPQSSAAVVLTSSVVL